LSLVTREIPRLTDTLSLFAGVVDDALIGAFNFLTLFAIPTDYLHANFGLAPTL
jgi:hypothetical protein